MTFCRGEQANEPISLNLLQSERVVERRLTIIMDNLFGSASSSNNNTCTFIT